MNNIRFLRELKKIQQKEMAVDLGVSQPTISDWESGRKQPSSKSAENLAEYFKTSMDFLLGRTLINTAHIKEQRILQGFDPVDIAQQCGIELQDYLDIESGISSPSASVVATISDILHCSVDYLLGLVWAPDIKKEPTTVSDDGLSDFDYKLIDLLRQLSPDDYRKVEEYVDFLKSKHTD